MVNTLSYGTDSLSFLGLKIKDILPDYIKPSKIVYVFKTKVRK